jgi:hypothetical protein
MAKKMMKKGHKGMALKHEPEVQEDKKAKMPGKQAPPGYSAKAVEPKGSKHGHGLKMGAHKKGKAKK